MVVRLEAVLKPKEAKYDYVVDSAVDTPLSPLIKKVLQNINTLEELRASPKNNTQHRKALYRVIYNQIKSIIIQSSAKSCSSYTIFPMLDDEEFLQSDRRGEKEKKRKFKIVSTNNNNNIKPSSVLYNDEFLKLSKKRTQNNETRPIIVPTAELEIKKRKKKAETLLNLIEDIYRNGRLKKLINKELTNYQKESYDERINIFYSNVKIAKNKNESLYKRLLASGFIHKIEKYVSNDINLEVEWMGNQLILQSLEDYTGLSIKRLYTMELQIFDRELIERGKDLFKKATFTNDYKNMKKLARVIGSIYGRYRRFDEDSRINMLADKWEEQVFNLCQKLENWEVESRQTNYQELVEEAKTLFKSAKHLYDYESMESFAKIIGNIYEKCKNPQQLHSEVNRRAYEWGMKIPDMCRTFSVLFREMINADDDKRRDYLRREYYKTYNLLTLADPVIYNKK